MIERIYGFCFGNQWHKYVTLLIAMALAVTCTILALGAEAGPRRAPIIVALATLLAFPISWLLRGIELEATDLAWSRQLAHAAAHRLIGRTSAGMDDTLLGDLYEYHADLIGRLGRRRANAWFRLQVFVLLLQPSRATAIRPWFIASLMVAVEVYVVTTEHPPLSGMLSVLSEIMHTLFITFTTSVMVLAWAEHIDHDFERFRSEKRSRTEKS